VKTSIRRTLKTAGAAALTAVLLAAGTAAATAHVTVDPSVTKEGGFTKLTFSVPNESATAKTNRLEVKLPTETPLTSVSVKPIDGWTAQVITTDLPKPVEVQGTTVTKAPTSVVWTADDAHQIGQNEFQMFTISVGRLPVAGTTVVLPAAQGYTDGTTVNWADTVVANHDHSAATSSATASAAPTGAAPSHPAPSFLTTAAESDAARTGTAAAAAEAAPAAPVAAASSWNGGDTAGWFGLAAGLIGLTTGVTALARSRPIRSN
jgi:periplasmic copper chaperone A